MLQSSVVLVTLPNYLLSFHTILISFLISEIYMKEIKEIIYFSLTCQTAPPSKTPGPEWGWRSCCSQPWGSTPGCRARLKLFFNTLTVASLILFLCCPPTGTNVQFVVEFSLVTFSQSTLLLGKSFSATKMPAVIPGQKQSNLVFLF